MLVKKSRLDIAVYGKKKLVEALANYFRVYYPRGECETPEAPLEKWCADIAIFKAMREDIFKDEEKVSDKDLIKLVHWCEVPFENCQSK